MIPCLLGEVDANDLVVKVAPGVAFAVEIADGAVLVGGEQNDCGVSAPAEGGVWAFAVDGGARHGAAEERLRGFVCSVAAMAAIGLHLPDTNLSQDCSQCVRWQERHSPEKSTDVVAHSHDSGSSSLFTTHTSWGWIASIPT